MDIEEELKDMNGIIEMIVESRFKHKLQSIIAIQKQMTALIMWAVRFDVLEEHDANVLYSKYGLEE